MYVEFAGVRTAGEPYFIEMEFAQKNMFEKADAA